MYSRTISECCGVVIIVSVNRSRIIVARASVIHDNGVGGVKRCRNALAETFADKRFLGIILSNLLTSVCNNIIIITCPLIVLFVVFLAVVRFIRNAARRVRRNVGGVVVTYIYIFYLLNRKI